MKIEQLENGNGMKVTNSKGESIELNFSEFWEICRTGNQLDTRNEIEEYLVQCDEIDGYDTDKILEHPDLMNEIVGEVIRKRINNENSDQIWEATKEQAQKFFDRAVSLVLYDYVEDNQDNPLKSVTFQVKYKDLEEYLDFYDCRTVEEFFENNDNEDKQVLYEYLNNDGRILSEETVYCDAFEEEYAAFVINKTRMFNPNLSKEQIETKEAYYRDVFYPNKVDSKISLNEMISAAKEELVSASKSLDEITEKYFDAVLKELKDDFEITDTLKSEVKTIIIHLEGYYTDAIEFAMSKDLIDKSAGNEILNAVKNLDVWKSDDYFSEMDYYMERFYRDMCVEDALYERVEAFLLNTREKDRADNLHR